MDITKLNKYRIKYRMRWKKMDKNKQNQKIGTYTKECKKKMDKKSKLKLLNYSSVYVKEYEYVQRQCK